MKAREVVIFPSSMRGTGEGHYSWSMPAVVANADAHGSGGSSMTNGTMTNGTMTNGTMTNGTMTNGTMTNGTMTNGTMTNGTMTNGDAMANGRKLTLSYNNGQKVDVTVPPGAPVVRFVPAEKSAVTEDAKVFIIASKSSGEPDAMLVAVGKNGLMPPM